MEIPKMTNPRYRLEVAFKTPHLSQAADKTHRNEDDKKKWVWFPKKIKNKLCVWAYHQRNKATCATVTQNKASDG